MELVAIIAGAWAWRGLRPNAVVDANSFGNLIVLDEDGQYWRICPEEPACTVIASDDAEYRLLRSNEEFQFDWHMERVREAAFQALGALGDGRCYCLKIPAVLGGEYVPQNFGTISLNELIGAAGEIARQIESVPDGTRVEFKTV